jgi:hypothetical protein
LLLLRIRKSRCHAWVNVHQAIDAGKGQHSLYGRCAHSQPHFTAAGLSPPEGTRQRAYSRRIAKGGLAQVGDQQRSALIDQREQILADPVGICNVYINGQRYDCGPADP